jgi:hypothetical protein
VLLAVHGDQDDSVHIERKWGARQRQRDMWMETNEFVDVFLSVQE